MQCLLGSWIWIPALAELVIGPATSGRTRWLGRNDKRRKMLDDAIKAITQIFAPPLRAVLWKSVGLALALIVVVGIVLDRLILWLLGAGSASIETTLGPHAHWPASALAWLLSVAASLGIIVGSVFLMPAVTAFVASFFADQIADE